ncbi:MAG: hypothetical protein ABH845_01075 [Candidatus Omnitrophota bacterium]
MEPIEDTMKAIDYIASLGAFPTVCIFRPLVGAEMEKFPSPPYEDMVTIMRYMYEACMRNRIPIGIVPNIEVSLIVQPDDAQYLATPTMSHRAYRTWLRALKLLARPYFAFKLRPRPARA